MESTNRHPLEGDVEISKFKVTTLKEFNVRSRPLNKYHIIMGIEKKSKGVARIYGTSFKNKIQTNLKAFINKKVSTDARIKVNKLILKNEGICHNLPVPKSDKAGKSKFGHMDRIIAGFKAWMKGIHGNVKYIEYYINEYCFRYNRHLMHEEVFDDLLIRMVIHKPVPYKLIIA